MKGMTEDEMVGGIINSMDVSWRIFWEIVRDWEVWHADFRGVTKSCTLLSN